MSEAAPRWVLHKGMWLAYIGERFTSELSAVCQSCPRLLSHLFCLNWVPLLSALLSGMICPVPLLPWAGNATSSVLSPRGGQCCHVHLVLGSPALFLDLGPLCHSCPQSSREHITVEVSRLQLHLHVHTYTPTRRYVHTHRHTHRHTHSYAQVLTHIHTHK